MSTTTTINAPSSNVIVVREGQSMTIVADALASGAVYQLAPLSSTASVNTTAIVPGLSKTLGPFVDTTRFKVVMDVGSLTTTVQAADLTAPQFVYDSAGNPLGLSMPGGGVVSLVGKSANATYDQYGRPSVTGNYAVPGFAGTQLVDFSAATRTYSNGAVDDYSLKLGQKVNIKLPFNASGATIDLTNFGGAAGTVNMSDAELLTFDIYRAVSSASPTLVNVFLCNTAGDFTNTLTTSFMVEATGKQRIAIPIINFHPNGTGTIASSIAQIRFRVISATTKECSPLQNSASDYVLIGDNHKNPRTRTKILMTMDDGNTAVINGWYPKLAAYGWTGTAYIVPSILGMSGIMTEANLATLKAAGWCIGNHSMSHPMNVGVNDGLRLLGPAGLVPVAVTGVNTTTGVFSVAALGPRSYGQGIIFAATAAPGGVNIGQVYYVGQDSTATTFKIYATAADAKAGTNLIIPSTAGSGVTFTYQGAAADSSAIVADVAAAQTWLNSRGYDGDHFAYPQNGHDIYTYTGIRACNLKTQRTAVDIGNYNTPLIAGKQPLTFPGYVNALMDTATYANNLAPFGSSANLGASVDMSLGLTAAVQAAIDYAVAAGGTLCLLDHSYVSANATAVCDYLKKLEMAGLLDVVNAREYYNGLATPL